jgi:hypothetical protein
MKRILALGILALGMTLTTQQQASAWCNFKFGAGINWNYQSGNNTWFCGLYRSGEVPGPEYFGTPGCAGGDCFGGYAPAYASGPAQYYGPNGPAYANAQQQQQQTPAAATGNTQRTPATTIPNYQPSTVPFQPTSYQVPYQGGYQGNYQYNPYWSNSYYGGGGYNYPAYNGWNWNYGYGY